MKKILYFLFLFSASCLYQHQLAAQCCTNCPLDMPDNFADDFFVLVGDNGSNTFNCNLATNPLTSVSIHFTHEYIGDLSMTLTSPAGQTITLVGPIGLSGATDDSVWNIDFVASGAVPDPGKNATFTNNNSWGTNGNFTGSYLPNSGSLSSFTGTSCGVWTLSVVDDQGLDVGEFFDFGLSFANEAGKACAFSSTIPTACPSYSATPTSADVACSNQPLIFTLENTACPGIIPLLISGNTGNNGSQVSWELISNTTNTAVASGGALPGAPTSIGSGGLAYGNNVPISVPVNLDPDVYGTSYTLRIYDSNNNGFAGAGTLSVTYTPTSTVLVGPITSTQHNDNLFSQGFSAPILISNAIANITTSDGQSFMPTLTACADLAQSITFNNPSFCATTTRTINWTINCTETGAVLSSGSQMVTVYPSIPTAASDLVSITWDQPACQWVVTPVAGCASTYTITPDPTTLTTNYSSAGNQMFTVNYTGIAGGPDCCATGGTTAPITFTVPATTSTAVATNSPFNTPALAPANAALITTGPSGTGGQAVSGSFTVNVAGYTYPNPAGSATNSDYWVTVQVDGVTISDCRITPTGTVSGCTGPSGTGGSGSYTVTLTLAQIAAAGVTFDENSVISAYIYPNTFESGGVPSMYQPIASFTGADGKWTASTLSITGVNFTFVEVGPSPADCSLETTIAYTSCATCPAAPAAVSDNGTTCSGGGTDDFATWQSGRASAVAGADNATTVSTVEYSTTVPSSGSAATGAGNITGNIAAGCASATQSVTAYMRCDNGTATATDDIWTAIGSYTLTVYPTVQAPTITNGTCTRTITGTCANDIVTITANPVGVITGNGTNSATFTVNAGSVASTINYTVTSGVSGSTCAALTGSTATPAGPTAGTLSGTQSICIGSTTTFTSTVAGGTWSSSAAGTATIDAASGMITGVTAGTATMTYTVTGTGGCPDAMATRTVTVTAPPSAGTLSGTQAICVGGTTTFSSTVAGGTWSSSATGIATINAASGMITGLAAGTATMTYTVTGTGGCPDAMATRTVTVTATPTAGTLSGTQAICAGGTTTFSSTVLGGTWSSSAAGIATIDAASGMITGVTAGTATMSYTVTGTGGCPDATATRMVTVTAPPSAGTLSGTQAICAGGTTTFSSTILGGTWSSSAAGIATIDAASGMITGVTAGTATMTYTVTGTGGCPDAMATRTVTVTAAPTAGTLSGTQAICVGGTTTFSSTVAGGTWSSSATGIATINAASGMITGVAAGTATMTYTVTGTGGCPDASATRMVTVTAAPSAGTLSGTQAICVGGTTTFSSTVAGGTWSSSATGIATINAASGMITGVAAGTATMTYTVTGTGGCPDASATRMVTVTAAPSAGTLSGTQAICVGGTTTFSSTVAGGTWSSSATGIATINAASGMITGVAAGTATMTYTVTGTGGCPDASATRTVTVTAPPSAGTLSGTQAICVGGTTTFSSTVAGGTWSSSAAGTATIDAASGMITGVAAGTATMTYTVTGTGGCPDATATRMVTVTAPPSAGTLSGTQAICVGGTTTFSSTVLGGTWSSSAAGIATIDAASGMITGVAAGTATMTYTVAGTGGCPDATATRMVTVNGIPAAPTAATTQTFCILPIPTVANLVASGTNINWYAAATGGSPLATTTPLVNGNTYYSSQTSVQGCESNTRTSVTAVLNAACLTAMIGTLNTTGTPSGFIAFDPCRCNNNSDPVTQDNGTFDEYIFVTGPSGAIITGTATGGTPSALTFTEVVTGGGMSTYTSNIFTHVDNIGYNANLFAQIGIAGTPFAIGSIGNKCLYPNVVIDPIGPFTNCEGQNMLTLEATVTPDIEGAFTWSGMFISEDGVLSFDPQLPVGNLAINLSFEATFEGNVSLDGGITAANPGCTQVATEVEVVITECCDVNPGVTITKTAGAIQYDQCANPDELISEITIRLTNTSGALLSNVYLDEIIGAVPAGSFLGLASYPDGMTTNATVAPAFNYNWNGTTNTSLFANNSGVLDLGQYIEVTLALRFNATLLGGVVCIPNAASGGGTWINDGSMCAASSINSDCTSGCGYPAFTTPAADLTVNTCSSYESQIQQWLTSAAGAGINHQCRTVEMICNNYCAPHAWQYLDNCSQNAILPVSFTVKYTDGSTFKYCAQIVRQDNQAITMLQNPVDLNIECSSSNISAQVQAWLDNNGGLIGQLCGGYLFNSNNYSASSAPTCGSTTAVTFTITNECGLSTSATANINIVENIPLKFTFVPSNSSINCNESVQFGTPLAESVFGGVIIAYEDISNLTTCGNGTVTRRWTATDANGNAAQAAQTITILPDTELPTLSLTNNSIIVNCASAIPVEQPLVSDNCSSTDQIILAYTDATVENTVLRTWTAEDVCGNYSTVTQIYIILDTQAPVFTTDLQNKTINCGAPVIFDNATATDACSAVSINYSDTQVAINCGTAHTRIWTATDASGNASAKTQTITVLDNSAPVFTYVPANAIVASANLVNFGTPQVTDACQTVQLTFTDVQTAAICANTGFTVTRTWIANDGCNNQAVASQQITIPMDTQAPTFTSTPVNHPVAFGQAVVFDALTATDNNSAVTMIFVDVQSGTNSCGGYTVTRTWTALDACDNAASIAQTIAVGDDTQAPVFTSTPVNHAVAFGQAVVFDALAATDNNSAVTVTFADVQSGTNSCGGYTVTRTWTALDACDNAASIAQTIAVGDDTQAPVFTSTPVNHAVAFGQAVVFDALAATDNNSAVTVTFADVQSGTNSCGGYTVTRTWTALDACDNAASISQTIAVGDDTQAPVFTSTPVNHAVAFGQAVVFDALAATDNNSAVTVTFADVQSGTNSCGGYTVTRTWTALDACDNAASIAQTIAVNGDTQAPVFISTLVDKTITCGGLMEFDSPTATDNSGEVQLTYTDVQSTPTCGNSGYNMTRTYTAADACNNAVQMSQTITIAEDTEAPVFIGSLNDVEMTQATFNSWVPVAPAATDNCQAIEVTIGAPVVVDDCNYKVDYTATDACNNFAILTQNIKIVDCLVLGTNEGVFSSVSIYPNPVETELNIVLSADVDLKNVTAQVFDMLGKQVVMSQVVQHQSNINVSTLAAGTYTLRLTAEGGVKAVKFVKQ